MSYTRQHLVRLIEDAKAAMIETGMATDVGVDGDAGGQIHVLDPQAVTQLILAQAISDSGMTISDSVDKLEQVAVELSGIAEAIKQSG